MRSLSKSQAREHLPSRACSLPESPREVKFWTPGDEPTKRQRSQKQEKRLAKALDGRVQPGSGAFSFNRGDVITKTHLIEAKTTKRKSYSLAAASLAKITTEAFAKRRKPIFIVCFENAPERMPKEWAMIPLKDLKELLSE